MNTTRQNPDAMNVRVEGCLSTARCGERLRVRGLRENCAFAGRLRELGFCDSVEVCKIADHGVCLCQVLGSRVALARELANDVLVERVA
ncbi:MAG: FeoA family protein [Terrimicrobiaceae bacterium]|nr:FeoA family protein [Terrimicrobiaceae bacterium]